MLLVLGVPLLIIVVGLALFAVSAWVPVSVRSVGTESTTGRGDQRAEPASSPRAEERVALLPASAE